MKKPMIVLSGPTAVGKTKLSISLAKSVNGEIISADSMQVYRTMDIGSAKIKPDEMDGVTHHLIDVLEPTVSFDVVQFQQMVKAKAEEIYARNHIPILVGGTGFYIQAVLRDIDFGSADTDGEDSETSVSSGTAYRSELEDIAALNDDGDLILHNMLKEVDPASAEIIHFHNVKRTIRALEFFHENGFPISEHNEIQKSRENAYTCAYFVLNDDRQILYEKIEKRIDQMMEEGLLQEVEMLREKGLTSSDVSMQGLGYKQIMQYLEGQGTLEEAVDRIKLETRHFAKRQLTWFRREKDVIWVNKPDFDYDEAEMLCYMLNQWNAIWADSEVSKDTTDLL